MDHDHAYKLLFSHPEMVRDLILGFVPEDWVKDVDFATLDRVNASYISADLRERADDIVWRVRFRDQQLYIYLLIEFQSTQDVYMAVRMLTYIGLLYQDLIKEKNLALNGRLPPVLPLVLYNGSRRWRAETRLSKLLAEVPPSLQAHQPALDYLLIDESSYTESDLVSLQNLAAALFRLENCQEPANLGRVIALLAAWLKAPEQQSLSRAFATWLKRLLAERMPNTAVPAVTDLVEFESMLAERLTDWTLEWKRQGLEEGIKQGIEQGVRQGESAILVRQLSRRFGDVPENIRNQIDAASLMEIEKWADRVLTASSLEDIFS